jgi:DNA polymerase-3 subunit delta
MKLNTAQANAFFEKPDTSRLGVLIFGADPMRVALKRQHLLSSLLGENAEEEMRLTRLPASDLRKDPAQLLDAVKAVGFFPGPRAVFVEDASDTAFPAIESAVNEATPEDAMIVVTAGQLKPTSKLRKLFEGSGSLACAALYDNPMTRDEIQTELSRAGLGNIPNDSMGALAGWAGDLEPGDFRQLLEKLVLYKLNDPAPLSVDDITNCAPTSTEAALDDILNAVAEARITEIAPILAKLRAQGTQPVGLCIGATRHFRTLYNAATNPQGIAGLRPPVYGPRRDRLDRQSRRWGVRRLETALTHLKDLDLTLRSAGQHAPAMPLVERVLIRLAHMVR